MGDRIELRGLRFSAVHGALAEERRAPQPFEVDVDLGLDLVRPGRTDDLADTVDYGAVAVAVAEVMDGPPANLLEHLADRVAEAVLDAAGPRVEAVTVSVRKLRPPIPHDIDSAGVRVTRPAPPR